MTNYYGALTLSEPTPAAGGYIATGTDEALDQFVVIWDEHNDAVDWDNPLLIRTHAQISFTRSVLGWYNIKHISEGAVYNVHPSAFRTVTGASDRAKCGSMTITNVQLSTILNERFTKLITHKLEVIAV